MPGIHSLIDTDNTQNTSTNGGSTGGPALVNTKTITINWNFPTTAEYLITGFDVVASTDSVATNTDAWLFHVTVDPTIRQLVKTIAPSATMPTVYPFVRAIYA